VRGCRIDGLVASRWAVTSFNSRARVCASAFVYACDLEMALEKRFRVAVDFIQGLPKEGPIQPSNDDKLKFYSLCVRLLVVGVRAVCAHRSSVFFLGTNARVDDSLFVFFCFSCGDCMYRQVQAGNSGKMRRQEAWDV